MKTIKLIAFTAVLLIAGKINAENISTFENCIRIYKDSTLHSGAHGSIEDYKASGKVRGYSILAGGGAILIPSGNFDMLNQRLSKNNYATISNQYSTWNISIFHAMYKNTVFNLNFGGILKKNTVSDSSKTTVTGSTVN